VRTVDGRLMVVHRPGALTSIVAGIFAFAVHNQPYSTYTGAPVTKVLALHPHLDLSRVRSWTELSRILAGLIQVRA
jgi:hypothetical protein